MLVARFIALHDVIDAAQFSGKALAPRRFFLVAIRARFRTRREKPAPPDSPSSLGWRREWSIGCAVPKTFQ
jgi:hypothetical protein